jgi:hypothetical protein
MRPKRGLELLLLAGALCGMARLPARGAGVVWHVTDPFALPYAVSLADTTDETWIAQGLNFQRLQYLQTAGDGTPIYEHDLSLNDPPIVTVASAEDTSLAVVGVRSDFGVSIHAFDQTSDESPLWTYTFAQTYDRFTYRALDVDADGVLVVAAAHTIVGPRSLLVVLDGETGDEVRRLVTDTRVTGVELSDDGARAVLTEGTVANIIETQTLTTLHAFEVSTPGGTARLSRDGSVAAAGAFGCIAYRDTGTGWTEVWNEGDPNQWYGSGLAVSGDGTTLFAASYEYPRSLDLTFRIIDLIGGVELARTMRTGSGSYANVVRRAQASADGSVFAVVSWGTENNDHPELQVLDRDARLLGSLDTPGSPFDVDLSRDGGTVALGAKAVHATAFGQGGDAYAYRVSPCHGDLDGDGRIDLADLAVLLANYGITTGMSYTEGDLTGDGAISLSDLSALLAVYGTSCP